MRYDYSPSHEQSRILLSSLVEWGHPGGMMIFFCCCKYFECKKEVVYLRLTWTVTLISPLLSVATTYLWKIEWNLEEDYLESCNPIQHLNYISKKKNEQRIFHSLKKYLHVDLHSGIEVEMFHHTLEIFYVSMNEQKHKKNSEPLLAITIGQITLLYHHLLYHLRRLYLYYDYKNAYRIILLDFLK